MRGNLKNWMMSVGIVCLAPAMGYAGDFEAEIEDLDARMFVGRSGYVLQVSYEVEAEEAARRLPLEMVLTLAERDRAIIDRHGRPFQVAVPVDRVREVDDDEIVYGDRLTIELPYSVIRRPNRLEVFAELYVQGSRIPIDQDDEDVDLERRRDRRHPRGWCGVGLGQPGVGAAQVAAPDLIDLQLDGVTPNTDLQVDVFESETVTEVRVEAHD